MTRHFRPKLKLEYIVNQVTNFLRPIIIELRKFFYNQSCCFLGRTNKQIQEDFELFFATIQEFVASKSTKKYSFEYKSYYLYLRKAKSRTLSKITQI